MGKRETKGNTYLCQQTPLRVSKGSTRKRERANLSHQKTTITYVRNLYLNHKINKTTSVFSQPYLIFFVV